jgi:hypothetical protein
MRFLHGIGAFLLLAFLVSAGMLFCGCHNLYPEDITSLHAADQQMLAAYQSQEAELRAAHERAAFCNIEAVERRHPGAGQLDTQVIVCQVPRK